VFGEVLSKSLADHLVYAIFAGTIKAKDQLFRMHKRAKSNPEWFKLRRRSVATEDDATIILSARP